MGSVVWNSLATEFWRVVGVKGWGRVEVWSQDWVRGFVRRREKAGEVVRSWWFVRWGDWFEGVGWGGSG